MTREEIVKTYPLLDTKDLKLAMSTIEQLMSNDDLSGDRARLVDLFDTWADNNDDMFYWEMMRCLRFIDEEGCVAYTTPDHIISLNYPNTDVAPQDNDRWRRWYFIYAHECLHQLWDTFGVERDIIKKEGSCNHELLNVASDCVINDFLENIGNDHKKRPIVGIFPDVLKKDYNIDYDRRFDTQYSLYKKLLALTKQQQNDIVASNKKFEGKIKPSSVNVNDGNAPKMPPMPQGKHSKEFIEGWTDAIQDVLDKKVDPLTYKPVKIKGGDYDEGYNAAIKVIAKGLKEGINISKGGGGGSAPNSDLPQIPWDMDNNSNDNSGDSSGESGDNGNSSKSKDIKEAIQKASQAAQKAADKTKDIADKLQQHASSTNSNADKGDANTAKDLANAAQQAADAAKSAADDAIDAMDKGNMSAVKDAAKRAIKATNEAASNLSKAQSLADKNGVKTPQDNGQAGDNQTGTVKDKEDNKGNDGNSSSDSSDSSNSGSKSDKADGNGDAKDGAGNASDELQDLIDQMDKVSDDTNNATDEKSGADGKSDSSSDGKSSSSKSSKGGKGAGNNQITSLTSQELQEIREYAEKTLSKHGQKITGPLGQFNKTCAQSKTLNEGGFRMQQEQGSANWGKEVPLICNNFVQEKIHAHKEYESTWRRVKRGSAPLSASSMRDGVMLQQGRIEKRNQIGFDVSVYVDTSGSTGSFLKSLFKYTYATCNNMIKEFGTDPDINTDEININMYTFTDVMKKIKYGETASSGGGTYEFDLLVNDIVKNGEQSYVNFILTDGEFGSINISRIVKAFESLEGMVIMVVNNTKNKHEWEVLARQLNDGLEKFNVLYAKENFETTF